MTSAVPIPPSIGAAMRFMTSEPLPSLNMIGGIGTPSFSVWNFRAGLIAEKYEVTAYVENAFDEQYFTGIDPTFGFSGVMIRPAQRIYGIRFRIHTN